MDKEWGNIHSISMINNLQEKLGEIDMNLKWRIKPIVSVIIATLMVLSLVSVVSAGSKSPFKGPWEATDHDNSNLQLNIAGGGGGNYRLSWRDDYWTICDGGPGIGRGMGTIDNSDPNKLDATLYFYCGGTLEETVSTTFTYHPATDMMDSDVGGFLTWSRVGGHP
jgi:hypothetical protein